jgi:hypothetical protein
MKPQVSMVFGAALAVLLTSTSDVTALTKKQIQTERNRLADVCRLSGGTVSGSGSHIGCCWANWGCLYCDIGKDSCEVICDTPACERANSGKKGNLMPGDVKPRGPRTLRPLAPDVGPIKKTP